MRILKKSFKKKGKHETMHKDQILRKKVFKKCATEKVSVSYFFLFIHLRVISKIFNFLKEFYVVSFNFANYDMIKCTYIYFFEHVNSVISILCTSHKNLCQLMYMTLNKFLVSYIAISRQYGGRRLTSA